MINIWQKQLLQTNTVLLFRTQKLVTIPLLNP